ncbi:MAG: PhnE/PtxC family ABC transporter permease [Phascolarctobacterium faecium]
MQWKGLTACGGTFWQKVCQGIVPTCSTQFIAWFLYCIELNIRASTIVGMVGGGGIGLVLFSYIKSFNYAGAAGIILVIAAMVIMVEFLTNYVRRKVLT